MRQEVKILNILDGELRPAGGKVRGVGIDIDWQNGPLQKANGIRVDPNGAFVEDVIDACKKRLEFYNSGQFKCDENTDAIHYLELALDALDCRTKRRTDSGVEGTHQGN